MQTIHLSPTGTDAGDGSFNNPVASPARALQLARAESGGTKRRILIQGAAFYDTELVLTKDDSGLTLEAAEGESPVFYGGRRVTGWRQEGKFWTAQLPGVKEKEWDFRSLLVNGQYATRARFPETGAIRHESLFPVNWMSTTKGGWERKPTPEELTTLKFTPGTLPESLDIANAELTLYHSWDESLVGVASIDHRAGVIRFSTPSGHPPGAFGNWKEQARTFVMWNTAEGMTRPGQWYLDRSAGRLVYWPLPEEDLATAEIIAPTRTVILRLEGKEGQPVSDITVRGLTLAATTTPMKAGGFGASLFEGAIQGEHLSNVRLDRVTVFGAGGWGIKLLKAQDAVCSDCTIRNTGAGALSVNGGPGEITGTLIHDVGLTYPSAMALNCHGKNWVVAHNEIHHTPYSAITGGGENLRFEHNLFHHIMQELVDGASIYVFAGKRCVLRGNYTHSVRDEQVHAYYLDEQCEESVVEGNLALGVPWPLHMHMATRCIIRNNICVHSGNLEMSLMNCDGFTVEGNVLSAGGTLKIGTSYTGIAELNRNVFWSAAGSVKWEWHDRLPSLERNAGPVPLLPRHGQTLIADPKLDCAVEGLVKFGDGSPAAGMGLATLDVRDAGRRKG